MGKPEKYISPRAMHYLYTVAGLSCQQIADKLGMARTTVKKWKAKARIPSRSLSEAQLLASKYKRIQKGAAHSHWKGGRVQDGNGYIQIWMPPDDPLRCMANSHNYVMEHRLIMAKHLGRPLTRQEIVHHKNGDKGDNRIENLILTSSVAVHNNIHSKSHLPVRRGIRR